MQFQSELLPQMLSSLPNSELHSSHVHSSSMLENYNPFSSETPKRHQRHIKKNQQPSSKTLLPDIYADSHIASGGGLPIAQIDIRAKTRLNKSGISSNNNYATSKRGTSLISPGSPISTVPNQEKQH